MNKHRAVMPMIIDPRVASGEADLPSQAQCTRLSMSDVYCPRHNPDTYADSMARHATDSFPVVNH